MSYIRDIALDIFHESGESDETYTRNDAPLWTGYAALALIKGESATSSDVHEIWSAWASFYHNDAHRSLVPFDDLSPQVQAYDDLYRDAIIAVAQRLRGN